MWEGTHETTNERNKMKLAIAGVQLSMFDKLNNNYNTSFEKEKGTLTISQPNLGPKSLDISSDDIYSFAAIIAKFDPKENEGLSMLKTVEKTIENDGECVTFRTSMAKGARAVKVPAGDWPDFVRWWREAAAVSEDLISQYKEMIEKAEKAEKAK